MGFRLSFIITALFVCGVSVWAFSSRTDDSDHHFEAHEFAVFRSEYDNLKVQSPEKRVEHFRDLLDTTESAHLTPGMTETLVEFCRKVSTSEEESPAVQDEARLVLHSLEAKLPAREPASVEHHK